MSLDFLSNLSQVITQVSKDKGISQDAVVNSIVQGVLSAVRKKYGTYRDIEVKYSEDTGEIELFEFKQVVSDKEFEDELIEIKFSEAKELDPSAHIGDQVGMRLELKDLGRIDAQAAKQIIIQNLRSIEHEIIFNEFEKRKGEIANGIVRRVDPGTIVVDLDKTEAYIPRKEQIPGEQYKSGERIQGYILEVRQTTRGPQIIMSRAHEQYLIKLFEAEVPEVSEGIVKIVSAAREPGQRAKMSVYSTDPAVHPVGSCVGIKGSRIQNITQELKGERVDVIVWENDPVQYICNALAPAKISKILMDEEQKNMQIIVPDDQLSLAIGKKGQNVRLAVKLTGWNLNLVSEEESKQAKKEALFNLSLIPEISETKAQSLVQYGYTNIEQIVQAKAVDLKSIPELEDSSVAEKLIQSAKDLLKKYADEGKELPKMEDVKEEKKPLSSSLKEQAEEILKRELAQLEGEKGEQETKTTQNTKTDTEKVKQETKTTQNTKTDTEKVKQETKTTQNTKTDTEKVKQETKTTQNTKTDTEKVKQDTQTTQNTKVDTETIKQNTQTTQNIKKDMKDKSKNKQVKV
ncbi:MAG: transcription termination factor NusA [Bdellovibrionaceae bacterium]|nr:transcription termination factor NusA [Pseudobdellovibrionaceae bacterium]